MTRLKWLVVSVFTVFLIGAAAPASAETDAERAQKQIDAMQLTSIKMTYTHARDAMFGILRAVDAYSMERANKDEQGMRVAAAALLMSLAESRFWMVHLDKQVTASQFGEKLDKDVADLTALITNAFNEIADELFANDLDAINKAMDESGNAFNILARSNQNLMTSLWPQLSGDK